MRATAGRIALPQAMQKKKGGPKTRTNDLRPRSAELTPLELWQITVKEAIATLFNRGEIGKLTPA